MGIRDGKREEGQALMRKLKMREAVFDAQFTEPDRTVFTVELTN